MQISSTLQPTRPDSAHTIILGGGCFWCLESEFRRLEGILYTRCGYEGGTTQNPTYESVCSGKTGHAEVVEISFDPSIITLDQILDHFLQVAHNPTELNRQGVDIGSQYRSVIFFNDEEQKKTALLALDRLAQSRYWGGKQSVTTLEPHSIFWPAEDYHQQYYERYEIKAGIPHIRAISKMAKWGKK
jgi:peptide-methionine (S)-S-oxide reductase